MWPFKKTIDDILEPKRVKIHGVKFKIRKINPLDHLTGARVMQQMYETYQTADDKNKSAQNLLNTDKIKSHYIDVLMCGIVEPKISRKKDEDGIFVENLMTDWSLAEDLYAAIMLHSFGKKKMSQAGFHVKKSSSWTA